MRSAFLILFVCASFARSESPQATITALHFTDALEGTIACADGTVWKTISGGSEWRRVYTGNLCITALGDGVLAGRRDRPGISLGAVVDATTGKEFAANALPALNGIACFGADWLAYGDAGAFSPAGINTSSDGGKTWKPLPGPRSAAVLTADFSDAKTGILSRADGKLEFFRDGSLAPAEYDGLGNRRIKAMRLMDKDAIAVGEGGLVLLSRGSEGIRWGFARLPGTEDMWKHLDFQTVAVSGSHIWIAGNPGSVVLHSADAGKTWEAQPLPTPCPVSHLFFLDERNGWAGTESGMVLKTSDAGKTWKNMGSDRRSAAHFAAGNDPAFDAVVLLAKGDGYRVTGSASGRDQTVSWRRAGAVGSEMAKALAVTLRARRPEVLVCDPAMVEEAKKAVMQAEDPAFEPEAMKGMKLQPWRVHKIFVRDDAATAVRLPVGEWNDELGDTAMDASEESRGLLGLPRPVRSLCSFRLVAARDPSSHLSGMLDGVPRDEATFLERSAKDAKRNAFLQETATERRTLQALLERESSLGTADQIVALVKPLAAKMPAELGARTCYNLGQSMARQGKFVPAIEVFRVLVQDYPNDPMAVEALRWLAQVHSSGEYRRRVELTHERQKENLHVKTTVASREGTQFNRESSLDRGILPIRSEWHRDAFGYAERFRKLGPLYANDIGMHLCSQAARRNLGEIDAATKSTQAFLAGFPREGNAIRFGDDPYRDALASELWLQHSASATGTMPKPTLVARRFPAPPKLDGEFDDDCWKDLPVTRIGEKGTFRVRFDDRFLYFAVEYERTGPAPKALEGRSRDMQLAGDRLSIMIDLDRDFQTFYRLEMDSRGATREDCCGDSTWNPKWYVATANDEKSWRAEIAIPLEELTGDVPLSGKAWAFNVIQWSAEGKENSWGGGSEPIHMGLLRFLEPAK